MNENKTLGVDGANNPLDEVPFWPDIKALGGGNKVYTEVVAGSIPASPRPEILEIAQFFSGNIFDLRRARGVQ